MRLLFVVHNLIRGNGQGRINLEIVRHALRSGHRVELMADQVADELIEEGATWTRVNQRPRRPNILGVYRFATAADRLLAERRGSVDLTIGAGFTLRSPHDVSLCQFVHSAWLQSPVHVSKVERGPKSWYQALYSRRNAVWESQSYAAARLIVAPSEKIRRELESTGIPADKISVIYNGVNPTEFCPGNESREALGLPTGVPLALFVGDIRTPRKNLDTVLKALVRTEGVHLVIVGAAERSPFPEMAERLGVRDRTHFVGFRSDVNRFMRACDLFVFPSRYEAGTLVLMEALASGLPVLTARSAGGSEVMNAECGIVLDDENDAAAVAVGIGQLLVDDACRRQASHAARLVAEQHSWTRMAEQYLAVFTALSDRTPARHQ